MLAGLQRHTAQRSHACSACSTPTQGGYKGGPTKQRDHARHCRRQHKPTPLSTGSTVPAVRMYESNACKVACMHRRARGHAHHSRQPWRERVPNSVNTRHDYDHLNGVDHKSRVTTLLFTFTTLRPLLARAHIFRAGARRCWQAYSGTRRNGRMHAAPAPLQPCTPCMGRAGGKDDERTGVVCAVAMPRKRWSPTRC